TIKRLLIGASPLFLVLFIESLTYHVLWWRMQSDYEGRKLLLLSHFIVDGLARTSIVWVLISIMVVPGVVRDNIPSEGAGVLSSGYPSQTTPYAIGQQQYPWQINGYQQPNGQQEMQTHPALLQSWHPQPNWQQQSQPVMQYVVIKKQNQLDTTSTDDFFNSELDGLVASELPPFSSSDRDWLWSNIAIRITDCEAR
ncbi:16848_t:CDS:2, partial [Acaulospora colombiana]